MTDTYESAPCRQTDPELFFPEKKAYAEAAKWICSTCPLETKTACARLAVESSVMDGVWAGEYLGRTSNTDDHKTARRNLELIAGAEFRTRPASFEEKETIEEIVVRMSLRGSNMGDIAAAAGISERSVLRIRKESPALKERRCGDCSRIMVPREAVSLTFNQAKVGAAGMCTACYQRYRRSMKVAV